MDKTTLLLLDFWQALNLTSLAVHTLLGLIAGLTLGVLVAALMQRRRWLQRRNRYYHYAMKLYFVLLPGVFCFLGLQIGGLFGLHRQAEAYADHFQPQIQVLMTDLYADFQSYLLANDFTDLQLEQRTPDELVGLLVDHYLASAGDPAEHPQSLPRWQAWTYDGIARLKRATITRIAQDRVTHYLADQTNHYTGMDQNVLGQVFSARLEQFFSAEFLVRMSKDQLSALMRSVYLGMLLQGLLVFAIIGLELALAYWLKQWHWEHRFPALAPQAPSTPDLPEQA